VETLNFNIVISNVYIEPNGNKIAVSFQSRKTKSVEIYEIVKNQTKLMDVVEISTE
jgi:hypothetical protein